MERQVWSLPLLPDNQPCDLVSQFDWEVLAKQETANLSEGCGLPSQARRLPSASGEFSLQNYSVIAKLDFSHW